MTQAFDAAVQEGCWAGKSCGYPRCIENPTCHQRSTAIKACLRAALPAEPTPEAIEAMARGLARLRVQQNQEKWNRPPVDVERAVEYAWKDFAEEASASYLALRAHLLGEDA